MKTPHNTRGFTMVELVMVIILLGILSVTAVSRFDLHSFESATVAGELISAIRYAQEKSMTNTGEPRYQIAITTSGYTVSQNGSSVVNPTSHAATYESDWTNVTLSPASIISFDGLGMPIFTPSIAGSQTLSVTVGSDSRDVIIEQITGFTR